MDLKRIESLLELMQEYGLAELELEEAGDKVALRMPTAAVALAAPAVAPAPAPVASAEEPAAAEGNIVKAPMVATFYRSSKPGAPPFAEVGDTVSPGQVLCILEAMKMMNEIECEFSGKIAEILVENGQPVQFGQPLFRIV